MALVNNRNEFGQVTPENGQKWDSTEPSRGKFQWGQADIVPAVAKKNGQKLRCHTLVWHSQLPSWVSSSGFTKQQLQSVIETHIANEVGHFKGQCYAWDVINEVIDDSGQWRSSVFYNTMGTDFIPIAFNAAAAADPQAKLYYNDYNLEYNGAKTEKALELVKIAKAAKAPISGVGFQAHMTVSSTPSRSALTTVLRRFTSLNLEVAYTELDIRHASLPPTAAQASQQGKDYVSVVGSCLDTVGCVGVTVWGISDGHSWIPQTFPGQGDALLYGKGYEKKPAWTSVSSVLASKTAAPKA